jgi:hypothetical protein
MGIGGWIQKGTDTIKKSVSDTAKNTENIINKINKNTKTIINEGDKVIGYDNANKIVKGTKITVNHIKKHSEIVLEQVKAKSNVIKVFSKNVINDPSKLLRHAKDIYGYGKYGFYYTEKYGKLIETKVNGWVLTPIKKTSIMVGKDIAKGFKNSINLVMKTFEDIADELTDIFDEFGDVFKKIIDNFKKITIVFNEIMDVVEKIQGVVKFGSIFNFLINVFEKKVVELIVLIVHINLFFIKLFIVVLSKTGLIYIPIGYFMLNIFNAGFNFIGLINAFALPYLGFGINLDYYYIGFFGVSYFIWYNSKQFMNKIIDLSKAVWKKIKLDDIIIDVVKELSKELLDIFTKLFQKIKNLL